MPGCRLGEGSLIGVQSIIRPFEKLAEGSVWAGSPAFCLDPGLAPTKRAALQGTNVLRETRWQTSQRQLSVRPHSTVLSSKGLVTMQTARQFEGTTGLKTVTENGSARPNAAGSMRLGRTSTASVGSRSSKRNLNAINSFNRPARLNGASQNVTFKQTTCFNVPEETSPAGTYTRRPTGLPSISATSPRSRYARRLSTMASPTASPPTSPRSGSARRASSTELIPSHTLQRHAQLGGFSHAAMLIDELHEVRREGSKSFAAATLVVPLLIVPIWMITSLLGPIYILHVVGRHVGPAWFYGFIPIAAIAFSKFPSKISSINHVYTAINIYQ